MKRPVVFLLILTGFLLFLTVVQIGVSNAFSTDGITLGKVENQITSIERENMILSEKLYIMSSYTNISQQAAALGFVEDKSQLVLTQPQPLALRQ